MPTKTIFVLNKPRNPNNIGASARGMANFGFRHLVVVNPYAVAWRETRSAVKASAVVEKAKKYKSLRAALKSSHVVIGTSAGSRRSAEAATWIGLDELRALVRDSRKMGRSLAIVFGSERTGLSNEDLNHCHYVLKIPTSPECPSMNLSQAVAVVACVMGTDTSVSTKPVLRASSEMTVEHMERLVDRSLAAFTHAKLLKGWTVEGSRQRLREAIYRWKLTKVDTAILHALFAWVLNTKGKKHD